MPSHEIDCRCGCGHRVVPHAATGWFSRSGAMPAGYASDVLFEESA